MALDIKQSLKLAKTISILDHDQSKYPVFWDQFRKIIDVKTEGLKVAELAQLAYVFTQIEIDAEKYSQLKALLPLSNPTDERNFVRTIQSLAIISNRLKLNDEEFWVKIFSLKIDLHKLDVFHKTNLLWTIAVKKHYFEDKDATVYITDLSDEL
jgi:hypothetical protein